MSRTSKIPQAKQAEILRLIDEGLTSPQALTDATGVDRSTIRRFLKSKRLYRPGEPAFAPWSEAELAILRPMHAEGATGSVIAQALQAAGFDRSRKGVEAVARKLGLPNARTLQRRPSCPRGEGQSAPSPLPGCSEERDARFVEAVKAAGGLPVLVGRGVWAWPFLDRRAA